MHKTNIDQKCIFFQMRPSFHSSNMFTMIQWASHDQDKAHIIFIHFWFNFIPFKIKLKMENGRIMDGLISKHDSSKESTKTLPQAKYSRRRVESQAMVA